ncbi:MAG: acyl-CoA dehydratase activase [Deltaproteobacteria bacterium]|jgi:predicted CoA-substrate-specific enzyme activase|nr:acyl-CoA dehydratase activase [Deltaproteobacteria bacterium]
MTSSKVISNHIQPSGYRIGLDLGSTAIKLALVKDGELAFSRQTPTAPGQGELARELVKMALDKNDLSADDIQDVVATGYGKKLAVSAGRLVNEISANAKGLFSLSQGRCRTIVNIGGQDLKVISIGEQGQVEDFKMNDKCAAGTGRFFEQVARILDTPIDQFGSLSLAADDPLELNSTCVVFAESEIVSLLAKGSRRENIIRGLHHSVARRVSHLLGRGWLRPDVYLDGGPALNEGLLMALEDELMMEVKVVPQPQFTVAYGAALGG